MIIQVILPQLGDTMDAGTVTRWYKQEGDAVQKGEPLFEVLTDKANIDVEATASGYVRKILCQENESAPTGQVIAYLTTTADEPVETSPLTPLLQGEGKETSPLTPLLQGEGKETSPLTPLLQGEGKEKLPSPVGRGVGGEGRKRQFISPRARRVAQEFGVDVSQISPSSKSGRVMEADVRKFLAQRAPAPALTEIVETTRAAQPGAPAQSIGDVIVPITGVRQIIFDRMGASAREIARVTLTTEADATELVALREQLNAKQNDMRFSFTDLLILLTARALLKYPYMNATLQSDGVHQHVFVNIGVAADTERGLLVPVVRDAHRKGLAEIYADVRRLSESARTGKISPDDLRGGTFTLTNLGAQEIDAFTPIVNQPEVAVLGIGRIAQKPAAYQGQLALRWMVTLSLSFDHRVVDGAPAGKFLQHVKHLIETPALILI